MQTTIIPTQENFFLVSHPLECRLAWRVEAAAQNVQSAKEIDDIEWAKVELEYMQEAYIEAYFANTAHVQEMRIQEYLEISKANARHEDEMRKHQDLEPLQALTETETADLEQRIWKDEVRKWKIINKICLPQ